MILKGSGTYSGRRLRAGKTALPEDVDSTSAAAGESIVMQIPFHLLTGRSSFEPLHPKKTQGEASGLRVCAFFKDRRAGFSAAGW